MSEKVIKWEILDRDSTSPAGSRPGVLAVAVFNPQVGDWAAYIGAYEGNSLQNKANIVAKHGTKLDCHVAGLIFSGAVGELNRKRMHAGAAPYRWRA